MKHHGETKNHYPVRCARPENIREQGPVLQEREIPSQR